MKRHQKFCQVTDIQVHWVLWNESASECFESYPHFTRSLSQVHIDVDQARIRLLGKRSILLEEKSRQTLDWIKPCDPNITCPMFAPYARFLLA